MYETARERRVMPELAVFARTAGFVNVSLKIFKSRTWSLRHVQLKNSFSIKKNVVYISTGATLTGAL